LSHFSVKISFSLLSANLSDSQKQITRLDMTWKRELKVWGIVQTIEDLFFTYFYLFYFLGKINLFIEKMKTHKSLAGYCKTLLSPSSIHSKIFPALFKESSTSLSVAAFVIAISHTWLWKRICKKVSQEEKSVLLFYSVCVN
jgi:hypothetical protein